MKVQYKNWMSFYILLLLIAGAVTGINYIAMNAASALTMLLWCSVVTVGICAVTPLAIGAAAWSSKLSLGLLRDVVKQLPYLRRELENIKNYKALPEEPIIEIEADKPKELIGVVPTPRPVRVTAPTTEYPYSSKEHPYSSNETTSSCDVSSVSPSQYIEPVISEVVGECEI